MFQKLFHSHGKLLLSGEYFVMDGALALVLPTRLGQDLQVQVEVVPGRQTPHLSWRSLDIRGECWFQVNFDFKQFELLERPSKGVQQALFLQKLLRAARMENPNFLSNESHVLKVTTYLEFPQNWGLGSSSTLITNMAHWACVSPFDLQVRAGVDGSGYDLAAAHQKGSILYQKKHSHPFWTMVSFHPSFASQIYFVYLQKKQSTQEAIQYYRSLLLENRADLVGMISAITKELLEAKNLQDFQQLLEEHENLVARALNLPRVGRVLFPDYWGTIKSLGAWGGDFVLVTSERGREKTFAYFKQKGFVTCLTYGEMMGDDDNMH